MRINQYRDDYKPDTINPEKYVDGSAYELSSYFNPQEVQEVFERLGLDNRKIEFCVCVAGSYEAVKVVQKRFGLSDGTYYKWLYEPAVAECIRVLRKNRRLKMMCEDQVLHNGLVRCLTEMLDLKTTNANFATKKELAIFIAKYLEGEKPTTSKRLTVEMTEIGTSGLSAMRPEIERDVTPKVMDVTNTDVLALKQKLFEEIEVLEVLQQEEQYE